MICRMRCVTDGQGITAMESVLLGDASARAKDWPVGSPYQKQSACHNLSTSCACVFILATGASDEALSIVTAIVLTFIGMSGVNHLITEVQVRRRSGESSLLSVHFCRTGGALMLVGSCIPVLVKWRGNY